MTATTVTPITGRVPKGSTDTALHRAHAARPARMATTRPQVDPERTAAMERVHDAARAQLDARGLYAVRIDAYPAGGVLVILGLGDFDAAIRFQGEPGTVVVEQRQGLDWKVAATATLQAPAVIVAATALAFVEPR